MNLPLQHYQYTLPPDTESHQAKTFGKIAADNFSIPPPLGEILYQRGFKTLPAIQDFLYPTLSMLPSPDTMQGMRQAVACVLDTVRANKPIFIHGDYDVDGITATALLKTFFREIGIKTICYIPNRLKEKYGLSIDSIKSLVAQSDLVKGGLLISVDCGITAIAEVAYAKEIGLRVIITDHHEPKNILPDAQAVINPKQKGCQFPFPLLSGVGVAFFLVIALRKAFVESDVLPVVPVPNLKQYLDLVALGTVADVVPLVGVNRILVRAGLEILSAKTRFGVFSLCECCGLLGRQVVSEDIAFKLAPRINASGRLGYPEISFDLLTTEDMELARRLAQELEQMNMQRKQLELDALEGIESKCYEQVQQDSQGLAVYQENCHPGVLGILASKISDRYSRPAIIFTDDCNAGAEHCLKGSGRSVVGVNLLQILERCSVWIEQFGGHAMAAGVTIKKSNFDKFLQSFRQVTGEREGGLCRERESFIDFHFQDKKYLTRGFAQALQLMQPFGEGNAEPKFLLSKEKILRSRSIKGHVVFQVQANGCTFPGIGFHLAETNQDFRGPVDIVFQLKQSWFKGVRSDQIQALRFLSL